MRNGIGFVLVIAAMFASLNGCSTAPKGAAAKESLHDDVGATMRTMQSEDPSLADFVNHAAGYVLFPSVGKGGVIVGGSYGRGELYEAGQMTGYADISQATIGAQAGGQEFSELIVFQNQAAVDRFKSNKLRLSANASAVALKSGAATSARYDKDGVAVFVRPTGGLMFEASVGGQSFSYQPVADAAKK